MAQALEAAGLHGEEVEFLLRFARTGHDAGYPTEDLEERFLALAAAVGLPDAEISATPTIVELSLGRIPNQQSFALRVRPARVDLDAVARLDDLVQDVLTARKDVHAALQDVTEIAATPLRRPWPVLLAAYSLAGAALTPVLGGGWREGIAGAVVGLAVGAVALLAGRAVRAEPMIAPLAAIAASFCAATIAWVGLNAAPDVVTLAALVTFLPGMTLTIGMQELATEHLQSGVANTASALVSLLGLVFGVGIGRSVAASWFGPVQQVAPQTAFRPVHVLGALGAGLAFTVTLRAAARAAPIMIGAALLALLANDVGRSLFGIDAGVFLAALAVGFVGSLLGYYLRRSALVFIVPGVLMLVPGSAGFRSALQLLSGETVSGIAASFDTFVTAMSIAYGLMVSAVVLPRTRR